MRRTTHARQLRVLSQAAKERLAEDVYNYEDIWLAIRSATRRGEETIRISQDAVIDFSRTKAATDIEYLLQKRGFHIEWVEVSRKEMSQRRETGRHVNYHEMVISWDQSSENLAIHYELMQQDYPIFDEGELD